MQINELIEILKPYKNKMFRYAYSIIGNRFEAEDIVQEAIIKIWKRMDKFSEIDNKEAWVITIVRNLAIDKVRAKKKKQTSDINDFFHISDSAPSPDIKLEQKDAVRKVAEIMGTLQETQREIITLRDIEGYTYQEIADIMELKVDQVKVYLFRARKILREKLAPMRKML
ncbi:MAG: RNA polymerase sigma factor [Saprospiraceae bacterium]|nr:RNA polymerase sigma factor [Saprospiraceae bacterium]